ncbi:hypothetical protein C1H46_015732 [Malus baccata]|uniref:Uncharacterized protein n=1 Tax=Malus baccata TaxID=106549 RepID=A0A540MIQ4_MALBA|nr:hypothetical protein C1H46_015732 [Malus baccata]
MSEGAGNWHEIVSKGFGVVLVEPNRRREESFVLVAFSTVAASVYEIADEFEGGRGLCDQAEGIT